MRYVSPFPELTLFRKNGEVAHKFYNGVLVVGDKTTRNGTDKASDAFGYTVDYYAYAGDVGNEMHLVKPDILGVNLGGAGFIRIEAVGLGYLNGLEYDGVTAWTPFEKGFAGVFFEAPEQTVAAGTDTIVVGAWYEVLRGSVVYAGTTYTTGQTFECVTGTTTFTGTGTVALCVTPLVNKCSAQLAYQFAIKNLKVGDESSAYWNYTDGGFTPRGDMGTLSSEFVGWIR